MADWSNPLITTQYDVFLAEAKERDVDSATMFLNAPTNQPVGAVKLLRSPVKLQEWSGAAWVDKVFDLTAGGTGATTAAGARAALGIGGMGIQDPSAVAITGGTILSITGLSLLTTITYGADDSYDLGSFAAQARKGYFKSALVLPVGIDKYATS